MPNKELLETYPLYRKLRVGKLAPTTDELPVVPIKMACPTCKSEQTFTMRNRYWELCDYSNFPTVGLVVRAYYVCTHCETFERTFYVAIGPEREWLMKVGQNPAWDVHGDALVERMLGERAPDFRKGLICESQGYGIGAFGYYRRIVECIIDELLNEIAALLAGDELKKYEVALALTKQTIVAQEKIELVKDLLPVLLRPDGMNPLSTLHSTLSEGLHVLSDEECLERAAVIREVLLFMVNQISASKNAKKNFTESMRKLLEKKAEKRG